MREKIMRRVRGPRFEAFIETRPALLLLSLFNWPRKKIRQLYGWVIGLSEKKGADRALASIAIAESSFFPIPPDPLLIAMVTAKPNRYLRLAFICTAASVAGGVLGYMIGSGLFETVGKWVIDTYNLHAEFTAIGERYEANSLLTIFTAAFTPIPYKLITISAGVFHVNFVSFIIASIIGRGARFFTVATLMHHFGKRYKDTIEKYIDILSIAFVALLILGVLALKYI